MNVDTLKRTTILQNIRTIEPLHPSWVALAHARLNSLTKPVGSLGRLEEIAAQVSAIQRSEHPTVEQKAVFVFAADHGVTAENVSLYPRAVTAQMVLNFLQGGAAINVLARAAGSEVHVVDVGVDPDLASANLHSKKIRSGTRNFLHEPAMSMQDMEAALQLGYDFAVDAHTRGTQMVATGEMGIGNTTSASAITAALTGEPAEHVAGKGTGISEPILSRKKQVIAEALALHFPNYMQRRPDPVEVLQRVGGLEIAAICGFILGAAHSHLVTVIDGFISTAAAAIACLLQPTAREYLLAGHLSQEPGHRFLLDLIGVTPLLNLEMRLGEGTGAVLAFHLIDSAVRIYNEMATFSSAGICGALS